MLPHLITSGLAALVAAVFWVRPPHPLEPPAVTILCYHHFDAQKITPFTVDSERFREQLQYLKDQHLPVITMAQLVAYIRSGTPVPDHSVVITIDDGYKTARTKALPILQEFGFPFTVFIYPQYIGHAAALSWSDVDALAQAGVDVQSHSLTHPLLTHPSKPMVSKEYIEWIDHELIEPKRILEARLKKPVNVLAYPFGGYDERIVERVRLAGYEAALTCDDGNVTRYTDALHLNRRLVYHHVKLKEFAHYFPDRTLEMTDLAPRDGEKVHIQIPELSGRIANIQQVLPGSVKILVDKAGHHPAALAVDPETGRFRFPLPDKRGYYFVSLFAKDRAQPTLQREASWIFIITRNASRN